jgi:hypothetical protein
MWVLMGAPSYATGGCSDGASALPDCPLDHNTSLSAHILGELGMRALDPSSTSGLLEQDPILRSKSFARWQSYRSHVIGIRDDRS